MKFSAYRLVLLLAALLCVAGCRPSTHYVTVEGSVLGTTFRIKARTTLPADEIYTEVMALDEEMKHSMSIFDETSLLSRINRGESDSLDSHLIYNILAADSVSRLSDGMYDITVKPLVEAWGFAGKEGQKTPNIDSILPLVGYRKIRIEGNRLVKDDPRIQLDFNSIGKGYMVDLIARMLERFGAHDIVFAANGEDAIARCSETAFELVFMDARMPRLDGLAATRALRAAGNPAYIIGVSADAMNEERDAALAAGMNDYVPKPIGQDAIASAISRWRETLIAANEADDNKM